MAAARFRELTGLEATGLRRIAADLAPVPPVGNLSEWQDKAEREAPVILARREQLTASEAAIDQYVWSNQLKVTGRAAYGQGWRGGNDAALLGVITPPGRVGGFLQACR
jgi:outer membrane protein TolC